MEPVRVSDDYKEITKKDVEDFVANPNAETKSRIADKVSAQYNQEQFTDSQIKLAEEIFNLLVKQAETEVKKTLAENLAANPNVPKDIMLDLAKDVDEVALPVLQFSDVLDDNDLLGIIEDSESSEAYKAIAKRKNVSTKISEAIIETKDEGAVGSLVKNEGANISDNSFSKVVDDFGDKEGIVESMITRGSLSPNIVRRMTLKVSSAIQKDLEEKYGSSFQEINRVFKETGEMAALRFMAQQRIDDGLLELVDQLQEGGQLEQALDPQFGMLTQLMDGLDMVGGLTPIACLAIGHKTLFEISLARMVGVPYTNIHTLMQDRSKGFKAVYLKADIPERYYESVLHVLNVMDIMEKEAKEGKGDLPHKNLVMFASRITREGDREDLPDINQILSLIENHIENRKKEH